MTTSDDHLLSDSTSGFSEGMIDRWKSWWLSRLPGWERAAVCLLILICLTALFSTALVQMLVVALTLTVLVWAITDRSFGFRRTPFDLPYAAFVAGRVLSILFSTSPELSYPALYIEVFYYAVFFLVTQSIRNEQVATVDILISALVGAAAIAGFLGAAKVFLDLESRASSTTAGVYTLGGYLCVVLPLALLRLPTTDRDGRGWVAWLTLLAICSGIIMTLDRLHWAGLAVMMAVAVFMAQRKKQLALFCCVLFLFLLDTSVWLRLERIVQYGDLTAGREIIWQGAWQLIPEHPITGFGPRTFSRILPMFVEKPVYGVGSWHNDYIQVYMESGLVGLLPLLWIVVVTYVQGYRVLRSPWMPAGERRVAFSLLASLSAVFLLGGIVDTHIGILFRTLLGSFALLVSRTSAVPYQGEHPPNAYVQIS